MALPTETVYGLAADAQDVEAVERVYAIKGRPSDHPLIVHVAGASALAGWSRQANQAAQKLAETFWPGALTVIVERSDRAGGHITGGQETVALRCPDHPVALACLDALAQRRGDPASGVAAPSANRFGRVSPTRAADVLEEVGPLLDPDRDVVIDGGACSVGVESTIVDCTTVPPRVVRLGAISQAQVDEALADVPDPADADGHDLEIPPREMRVPGRLEAHYSPQAGVFLVDSAAEATTGDDLSALLGGGAAPDSVGLLAPAGVATPQGWRRLLAADTSQAYAQGLYSALRQADTLGLDVVVAVLPEGSEPLADAVRDRLARASRRS